MTCRSRPPALGFDAPVHALVTGAPDEFDRRIEVLSAPRYGIVGQSREIEVAVREAGKKPDAVGQPLTLNVRREGRADEQITTTVNAPVKIEMPFPHAGQNILEVDLDTAPGELTPANNRAVIAAEGVRENLRVLLVSGEPHAGERTWRNLLKSDAAVDLVHFTILRPPEKHDGTPINQLSLIAFPTRELFSEKINDFDLIIFDRYQHRGLLQLPYYDNIARYVEEHGGALLVAAGDDYAGNLSLFRTPLSPVLPAIPTGRVLSQPFKAKLTGDGRKHPVTQGLAGAGAVNGQPTWGRWFRQVEVQPEHGRTLMDGAENEPLLVLDHKGKGRVALLTSDQAWLWARGYEGGGPHSDLLRRLSHWLMKEPDLEEERLIASARGLHLTLERRSMEEKVPPVALSGPGGETSEVKLEPAGAGIWRASVDVKIPGLYKAQTRTNDGELQAVAHAGIDDPIEMSEVTATDRQAAADRRRHGRRHVLDERVGGSDARQSGVGRRAARVDAVERQGARRLRMDGAERPRGVRHPRRQADADVHRAVGAGDAAAAGLARLVARGPLMSPRCHRGRHVAGELARVSTTGAQSPHSN